MKKFITAPAKSRGLCYGCVFYEELGLIATYCNTKKYPCLNLGSTIRERDLIYIKAPIKVNSNITIL